MEGNVTPTAQVDVKPGVRTSNRFSLSRESSLGLSSHFQSAWSQGVALSSLRALETLSYLLALGRTTPDTVMTLNGCSPPGMEVK